MDGGEGANWAGSSDVVGRRGWRSGRQVSKSRRRRSNVLSGRGREQRGSSKVSLSTETRKVRAERHPLCPFHSDEPFPTSLPVLLPILARSVPPDALERNHLAEQLDAPNSDKRRRSELVNERVARPGTRVPVMRRWRGEGRSEGSGEGGEVCLEQGRVQRVQQSEEREDCKTSKAEVVSHSQHLSTSKSTSALAASASCLQGRHSMKALSGLAADDSHELEERD